VDDQSSKDWKNVIFLVLDACRSDFLEEYAPNTSSLAGDNLYFRNAVAPSDWSLPSHASLFSGDRPHEHGQCSKEVPFESVPLVEKLNDDGYTTYGVSSNPFCNYAFDFDVPFDEFVSTMDRSKKQGLWVGDATDAIDSAGSHSAIRQYASVFLQALRHDAPLASLFNCAIAGKNKAVRKFDALSKIPHPDFQKNLYGYSPEWNTETITDFIEQESKTSTPFFIFSNYMDTHRPYYPSPKYQRRALEKKLSFREIKRLNEGIGHPQRFLELDNTGQIDEADLETLQSLYAGTVMEVDEHIQQILTSLDKRRLRDETLVVIAADHGENLGEEDPRGGRRMGHIESVSDNHLTVPLIIANPSIKSKSVSEYIPLTCVFDLMGTKRRAKGVEQLFRSEGPVTNECPASKEDWLDKYPNIPQGIAKRGTQEHICVSYGGNYKIAMSTIGSAWAWNNNIHIDTSQLPKMLRNSCSKNLEDLKNMSTLKGKDQRSGMGSEASERLNDLGYL